MDIKKIYATLREKHVLCNTAIAAWNAVKKIVGPHPLVQYRLAMAYLDRDVKVSAWKHMQKERAKNEREWWSGGRERHYLAKFGKFGGSHVFLTSRITQEVGMDCHDVEDWDHPSTYYEEESSNEVTQRWVKKMKCASCARRNCTLENCGETALWFTKFTPPTPAPHRSIMLLTKIRALRVALRNQSYTQYVLDSPRPTRSCEKRVVGEPQMEGRTGETLPSISSENVVLTEENPGSMDIAANKIFSSWQTMCSTDNTEDYSQLLSRWTYWKSFEWSNDTVAGGEIASVKCDLPYDFVNSVADNGSMPMFVPFKIYRYYKSDIEIKFHVNSNKFQVGQLQFSWQYMEKFDANKLDNMYSRSQLPHVLVNAGASNEATLVIPYVYIEPFMNTHQRYDEIDCLYLGTLRCFVSSRLSAGTDGPKTCGVSMFVRFPNAVFTGLRDGSIGEPQMMAAAGAMVAAKAYDALIGDKNCDKPTTNVNPQYVIPLGTHPWAAGKGISDHLLSLRLDGSVKSVGRSGILDSETSIGVPCRTFGMLNHFFWDSTDKTKNSAGSLLFSVDAHPQLEPGKIYSLNNTNGLKSYAYPPVSVISGLYKYWRGSLEFKFDIIASMFHTGRLLCAYIPGLYGSTDVSLAQARNSPHIEFSLQDATSFTFVVPYISDSVWWSRKYTGPHKYNENNAPSKLVMFVLNPLIPMQNVISSVEIIPYVRAGVDFEVSVPVQPSFGLSDNCGNIIPSSDYITPTGGSYPMYATNYEGFGEDKYYIYYEGTAAFGTASTFNAPQTKLQENEFYYGKFQYPDSAGTMLYNSKDDDSKIVNAKIGYIVLWGTSKGNFGIPFPNNSEGERFAKGLAKALFQKKSEQVCLQFCYKYKEDGSPSSSTFGLLYAEPKLVKIAEDNDFDIVGYPEMERASVENLLQPNSSLPSTSSGNFTFNEQFDDLKDLARRYQLYASGSIKVDKDFTSGSALAVFPVIPHGLDLDIHNNDVTFNNCRDGPIPLISSSYIYFRGSLRFKILVQTDFPLLGAGKVWVQHHPDGDCIAPKLQVYPDISDEDSFRSHGYGFYIQNVAVNSVLEFEVPFYQPGMYGLTRKQANSNKSICKYYTLGNIVAGVHVCPIPKDKVANVQFQVYYSIGDDFSFNVFRGFPMVVRTDEIWPIKEKAKVHKKKKIVYITGDPQMEEATPEMMSALTKKIFGTTPTETVTGLATDVTKSIMNAMKDTLNEAKVEGGKVIDELKSHTQSTLMVTALGNLAHILHNPTPGTIAISVANVIIAYLGCSYITLAALVAVLKGRLIKSWYLFVKTERNDNVGTPESDITQDNIALGSLIFTGVCGLFGTTMAGPKAYPDVIRNINSTVSLTNNVMRLIQNSSDLIMYCIKYVSSKLYPAAALSVQFSEDVPTIKLWYNECIYLLDSRVRSKYLYDKSMMSRVYDACVTGSLLIMKGMDRSSPSGKIVCDTYKEIKKIRNDLFERGVHPDVRFEVYPLWLSGEAGIGKSFMVKRLINDLLKSVDYSAPGSLIYDIPSGAKYWSGCSNPAALVSDDIFQVGGTRREEELANLFMICSSSVLNPPMAAVEDKEKRINPLIYMMLCNAHFPELSPMVSTPEAVYRRRKFLLYARIKPALREQYPNFRDASQLPREIIEKMEHLEFRYALNVRDPNTTYTEWFSYSEILAVIQEDFKRHYENEQKNFRQRMIDMYCLDPDFNETNIIMDMPELEELPSLQEQIDKYKEKIALKAAMIHDPEDKDAWTYIRKFLQRCNIIKDEFQMDEPCSSTCGATAQLGQVFDNKLEEVIERINSVEEDSMNNIEICFREKIKTSFPDIFDAISKFHEINKKHFVDHIEYLSITNGDVLDDLPFAFLEPCKLFSPVVVAGRLRNVIRTWATDSEDPGTYNLDTINKILNVGNFSHLELMRFIGIHQMGTRDLATVLFNARPPTSSCPLTSTLDITKDFLSSVYTVQGEAPMKRGPGFKKDRVRHFLSKMAFDKPSVKRNWFVKYALDAAGISAFVEKESPLLFNGISRFRLSTKDGIIESIKNFKEIAENKQLRDSDIFLYVCKAYSISLLADAIFGVHYLCPIHFNFKMLVNSFEGTEYCSISNKLVCDGDVISQCENSDCLYNNDLLYYYLCDVSVSCQSVKTYNYGRLEVSEIHMALMRRRAPKMLSTFEKLKDWVKCLIIHKVPIYVVKLVRFIINSIPIILAAVAAMGIGKLANKCLGLDIPTTGIYDLIRPSSSRAPPQANYFKIDHPKHHVNSTGISIAPKVFSTPQMSVTNRRTTASMIERNMIMLYATWIQDGNRHTRSCTNLMIKGYTMLVLRHYLEEYKALIDCGLEVDFYLYFNNGKSGMCKQSITWYHLYNNVNWCTDNNKKITSNFGLVELTKLVPLFRDITSRIASISEHKNTSSVGDLYVLNGDCSFGMPLSVKKNFLVSSTETSSAVYVDSVYSYNRQFRGLCGSVLVSPTLGSGAGAIIGIHVAGNSGSGAGYAEPLYKELFDNYFKIKPQITVMELPVKDDIKPNIELDANLLMYGCVDSTYSHSESGKTKIVPSLLHGEIYPVKTAVAPLRPNDPRQPPNSHPLKDGCEKHGSGDIKVFEPLHVQEVEEAMVDRISQIVRPIRSVISPLTLQQAVCGDTNVPYFESLNWKSSEGFPLSSHRPKSAHDKKWLFNLSETESGYKLNSLHEKLEQQLKLRDMCFEKNIKPPTVYIDCLKDARLPIEKCKIQGKTRIFSIAPVQCSIDIRTYLNDFCASVKNSRIKNSIAIGINPDSLEWTKLVNYLFEAGTKIITLDYSNFGPCLMTQLVAAGNNVIAKWHENHGATQAHVDRVKWLLECDILNPVHLSSNVVYQTLNGISSGSPLTGECNSIPNLFYIRLTWLEIMDEHFPEWASMYMFDFHVRLVVYGDDLIMSVSDEASQLFNALTIRDYLRQHGITVTSAQKDSEMTPYTSIYEATFLKRGFKEHPFRVGVWLAPIDKQSIEECVNWVHVSENIQEATLECCRASMDLAYGQGPEYYSAHYNKLRTYLNSNLNLQLNVKTWHTRDTEIFDEISTTSFPSEMKIKLPEKYNLENMD